MTKLKSKKMTKSTFAIIIMAIAMVAMLAFGGTYAYFTASGPELTSSTATTGKVKLGAGTTVTVGGTVVSGQSIITSDNKAFSVTNESTVDTYIFLTFTCSFAPKAENTNGTVVKKDTVAELKNNGDYCLDYALTGWTALTGVNDVYFIKATAADNTYGTGKSFDAFKDIKFYGISESTTTATGALMEGTITVSASIKAIQTIDEATGAEFAGDAQAAAKLAYDALNPVVGG